MNIVPDNTRHGHSRRGQQTQTYKAWCSMHRRCSQPSQENYHLYGGRGIAVCDRWKVFENFLADMGECNGLTLDRWPNAAGHYEPGNCRWASQKEQQRNRRGNRLLTHEGETLTVAEWAERTGVGSATIRSRIDRYGWSVSLALTTPHRSRQDVCREASKLRWMVGGAGFEPATPSV